MRAAKTFAHARPISHLLLQILTMSGDEEVAYATIAAVSQAKMRLYHPLLQDASSKTSKSAEGKESEGGAEVGADARTLAKMLVTEEKKVLSDLRLQLMSVVSRSPNFRD